jgi:hypothetical protein
MSLYPATQSNPKLAANVVAMLDTVMGGEQGMAEGVSNDMSTEDMIAYLRQHHDKNLHQDYLNHITSTNSKFVLKNIPINSIRTELSGLDRAKVEQYKKMDFTKAPPIVVGSDGNILDGYHRANVAKALSIPTIKAYVGVNGQQDMAEDVTVTRIDSKPIVDFASDLKGYKHTDDWSQSGLDTGDDSYWNKHKLKVNSTKGLFAGDPRRTALYATGNAHETRYVEYTENGQPVVYFDKKDIPAMRSRKTYLTVFDADNFKKLPTGEWFSKNPGTPIKQTPIGDPFKYIASQGWIVRVTDDLDKVFDQVKKMHKAGKIAQYGAEGMDESQQDMAEMTAQNFVGGMTASYQARENQPVDEDYIEEKWSQKYKSSINCANPKGFSQRAHCAGRKK